MLCMLMITIVHIYLQYQGQKECKLTGKKLLGQKMSFDPTWDLSQFCPPLTNGQNRRYDVPVEKGWYRVQR